MLKVLWLGKAALAGLRTASIWSVIAAAGPIRCDSHMPRYNTLELGCSLGTSSSSLLCRGSEGLPRNWLAYWLELVECDAQSRTRGAMVD